VADRMPQLSLSPCSAQSFDQIERDPLPARGALLRRKYALIYRAGLLNKTGPLEITLPDKLNNFAHLLSW
jgi:hypothetical protein